MNTKQNKGMKIIGWLLLLISIGFFCIQMGYVVVNKTHRVEYIDDQIFYLINIIFMICLAAAIFILLTFTKKGKVICASMMAIFIIGNGILLIVNNQEINNIRSISPDYQQTLLLKENIKTGETNYYRIYYGILALPKEKLPYKTDGKFKVEWLAKDIAAVTYKEKNDQIHQFIATYGDRSGAGSYQHVGAEIHGQWQGDHAELISGPEGITVIQDDKRESFEWDHVVQFGTIAIVLTRGKEAVWTISLNENIIIDSTGPITGDISLYKATMEENEQIVLTYKGPVD